MKSSHASNAVLSVGRLSSATIFLLTLIACSGNPGSAGQNSLVAEEFVENSGMTCAMPETLPFDQLPVITELPNPFVSASGTSVIRKNDWRCRRAEIGAQAQAYELGLKPPAIQPQQVQVTSEKILVRLSHQGKQIEFEARIHLPAKGKAPYPAVIALGKSFLNNESLSELGVAVIDFPNNDLAEQMNSQSRGKGKFYELFGADHSASAMMAWSWGISRLIDTLEISGTELINVQRLGVTGCSRNGKGALVAGAFDERIALTLVQESGSGGAASWRISDAQRERGQNVQTLRQIVTENVWFREDFSRFAEDAERLPYDHHSLMGMVAPRALLVVDNGGIEWLGNQSSYATSLAAREIWKAMGIPNHMGVSQQSGHNHCVLPEAQTQEVAAFVRRFLLDEQGVSTDIQRTDVDYDLEWARWVPWQTPAAPSERLQLKNAEVHLELVPGIGARAVHFSLPGKSNLFRVNEALLAQQPTPAITSNGQNLPYFGHEVWLGPQSAWWKQQALNSARRDAGAVWPPDPYLVLSPYQIVTANETQVSLRGPESPVSGVRMSQDFLLHSDMPSTIKVSASAQNIRDEPLSWGLWFNTRVHPDTQVYVPVNAADDVRLVPFPGPNSAPPAFEVEKGLLALSLTNPGEGFSRRHGKLFIHPSAGWMAGFRGDQLFLIHFDLQPRARIHPEQGQIELYHDYSPANASAGVLEMEVHFPYGVIQPGQAQSGQERWTVLPYTGANTPAAQRVFLCKQLRTLALDASVCENE